MKRKSRKGQILGALFLVLALALTACGGGKDQEEEKPETAGTEVELDQTVQAGGEGELIIFAAASMTETVDQIIEAYKAVAPDLTITPTYDSSGTLLTQIESGADCDIFISAAQKQMNALDEKGKIDQETRVDLLENKVVLVVPEGNPKDIQSFEDLGTDKLSLIALGNADVPVGSYSEQILTKMGIFQKLQDQQKITFASNVKEVTTQVSEGLVDCGIIYQTDAYSAGLTVVDQATADMMDAQVIYPAAVLTKAKNPEAAKAFMAYLQGQEATAVFESVGFTKPVK